MPLALTLGLGICCWQAQSAASTYDTDATALFARMSVQPDATRKTLISNQFIAGKAKSFWAKLDAIWIFAAHDSQAATLNWLNSNFTATTTSSPTFTTDQGYAGNGTSSYLDLVFDPTTATSPKFTQNSATFVARSNTDNSSSTGWAGWVSGTNGVTINPRNTSDITTNRINSAAFSSASSTSTSGVGMFGVSRTGASTCASYRNGTNILNSSTTSIAPVAGSLKIGSINLSSWRANQASMAAIGSGFTDQEHADIYSWFETYRTSIGLT